MIGLLVGMIVGGILGLLFLTGRDRYSPTSVHTPGQFPEHEKQGLTIIIALLAFFIFLVLVGM